MFSRFFAVTFPSLSLALVFVTGCSLPKPLSPQEVQQLTTCSTGDLGAIKKNLVLAGWAIEKEDGNILETDFKPVDRSSGYQRASNDSERISVVRLDEHTVRFVVRQRSEGYENVTTGEQKDARGRTVGTTSQVVNTHSESEESYYDWDRVRFAERRRKVCGDY